MFCDIDNDRKCGGVSEMCLKPVWRSIVARIVASAWALREDFGDL